MSPIGDAYCKSALPSYPEVRLVRELAYFEEKVSFQSPVSDLLGLFLRRMSLGELQNRDLSILTRLPPARSFKKNSLDGTDGGDVTRASGGGADQTVGKKQ